jgi:hypothetical protein
LSEVGVEPTYHEALDLAALPRFAYSAFLSSLSAGAEVAGPGVAPGGRSV